MEIADVRKIIELATLCRGEIETSTALESVIDQVTRIFRSSKIYHPLERDFKFKDSIPDELQLEFDGSMKCILGRVLLEIEKSFPQIALSKLLVNTVFSYVTMGWEEELLIIVSRVIGSPSKHTLLQRLAYLRLLTEVLRQSYHPSAQLIRACADALSRLLESITAVNGAGNFEVHEDAADMGGTVFAIFICFEKLVRVSSTWWRWLLPEEYSIICPKLERMYKQIGVLSHYVLDVMLDEPEIPSSYADIAQSRVGNSCYTAALYSKIIFSSLTLTHDLISEDLSWRKEDLSQDFLDRVLPNPYTTANYLPIKRSSRNQLIRFLAGFFAALQEIDAGSQFSITCLLRLSQLLDVFDITTGDAIIQSFLAPAEEMGRRSKYHGESLSRSKTIHTVLNALRGKDRIKLDEQRKNAEKPFAPKAITQTYWDLMRISEQDEDVLEVVQKWAISGLRHPSSWFTRFCAVLFFYQSAPQVLISRLSSTLEELLREETSGAVLLVAATFGNTLGSEEDVVKNFKWCKHRVHIPCFRSAAFIFGERILELYDDNRDVGGSLLIREVLEFGGQSRPSWFFKSRSCGKLVWVTPPLQTSLLQVLDSCITDKRFFDLKEDDSVEIAQFLTGFPQYYIFSIDNTAATCHDKFISKVLQLLECFRARMTPNEGASQIAVEDTHKFWTPLFSVIRMVTAILTHGDENSKLVKQTAGHIELFFAAVLQQVLLIPGQLAASDFFEAFLALTNKVFGCQQIWEMLSLSDTLVLLKIISDQSGDWIPSRRFELLIIQRKLLELLPAGSLKLSDLRLSLSNRAASLCLMSEERRQVIKQRLTQEDDFRGASPTPESFLIGRYWEALQKNLFLAAIGDEEVEICDFFAAQIFRGLVFPTEDELTYIVGLHQGLLESCLIEDLETLRNPRYCEKTFHDVIVEQRRRCCAYCKIFEQSSSTSTGRLSILLKLLSVQAVCVRLEKPSDPSSPESDANQNVLLSSCVDFCYESFRFVVEVMQRHSEFGLLSYDQRDEQSASYGDSSIDTHLSNFAQLLILGFLTFVNQFLIPVFSSSGSSGSDDGKPEAPGCSSSSCVQLLSSSGWRSDLHISDGEDECVSRLVKSCEYCSMLLFEVSEWQTELLETLDKILDQLSSAESNLASQPMWSNLVPVFRAMRKTIIGSEEEEKEPASQPSSEERKREKKDDELCEDADVEPPQKRRRRK